MQKISLKKFFPLIAISVSVLLSVILFAVLNALPIPLFLPCTHPFSQTAILALGCAAILQALLGAKILPGATKWMVGIAAALVLLAVWLGSYPFSPLGFADGRIPVLRGFLLTTRSLAGVDVAPGEIVTLSSGSAASIEPLLLAGDVACIWSSANQGVLDNPNDCTIAYRPPQAEYDILKVRIQPACGLPGSSAQIKISILP